MKNLIYAVMCCCFLISCTHINTDEGLKPDTQPFINKGITDITIKGTGLTSPASDKTIMQCDKFTLSLSQVNTFFSRAEIVSQNDYLHMLDWSPCYTEGALTLKDKGNATWAIHQFKAGSLVLHNGKTIYLYCPKCADDIFGL